MQGNCYQTHILSKYLILQNHSMDVFMLPNRTFTNTSQLMQTSSTDERAQNRFFCVLVVLDVGVRFNEPVHKSYKKVTKTRPK